MAAAAINTHITCDLKFHNLNCEIIKNQKLILNNLNGKFPGGSFVAILGPSGSGKTTLLNTLSGYRYQNATVTLLQINGMDTDFENLQRISSYITQDIHLNDLLTVGENMLFAADFKLGLTHSQLEKIIKIDEILDCFGLSLVKEIRTGKLSGGERKRLAIAMEILSDPKIIYLDEPTTGLDISTTQQILNYLKMLTQRGITIICTIHQVCASHFELFDLAYVIADGQCAYNGPPKELVTFLDSNGMPCNIYHNPADFVIELCCGDFGTDRVGCLVSALLNDEISTRMRVLGKSAKMNVVLKNTTNASGFYKFKTLLRRETVKMQRNLFLTHFRLIGPNFLGLLTGLLCWNIGSDATKFFFNYNLVMCMVVNLVFGGLLFPLLSFPLEMDLVKREIHNKHYSVLQYYAVVVLLDLPISVITIISSNFSMYYLSGQPLEANRIFLFIVISLAMGTVVNSIGFFFGTLLNLHSAIFFGTATQLPLLSISGFGIIIKDLPWYLEIVSRFVYVRCGIMGIMIAIFGLDRGKLDCPDDVEYCYCTDPNRLMEEVGIDPHEYMWNLYVLLVWLIIFRVITYFSMKYRLSK